MAPRRTLTPALIVDAAVAIAARAEPDGLTGRVLGQELGVDRSAVWRHFPHHDALLLAVGDRLLAMALASVPAGLGAQERLDALARAVVATYVAHPYVGASVSCRTTQGPGEFAVVEFTLAALEELGVPTDQIASTQRLLADTVLAHAGFRAGYAVLPPEVRQRDEAAWAGAYTTASPAEFPAVVRHSAALTRIYADDLMDAVLAMLRTVVRQTLTRTTDQEA